MPYPYPRYAMLDKQRAPVRVLTYVGNDRFEVLRKDDSVVRVHRNRLTFIKTKVATC